MARGLHALLPPIEVVTGSLCNADPDNPRAWEDGLAEKLGSKAGDPPRRVRDAPFVQIPLGVTEDRLVGTVDIEASMRVSLCSCLTKCLRGSKITIAYMRVSLCSCLTKCLWGSKITIASTDNHGASGKIEVQQHQVYHL